MKTKIRNILVIFVITFLMLIPSKVLANTITVDKICTDCSNEYYNILGYKINGRYAYMYLNKNDSYRMHGYKDGDTRLFCVDPTRKHGTSYNPTNTYDGTFKERMYSSQWYNNMKAHLADIQKMLSCRTAGQDGSAAAQALIWELVSNERNGLPNYIEKILKKDNYKTASIEGFQPIYDRLSTKVKGYYKSTLRCAARYNINPSFSSLSQANAPLYKLSNYSNGSYSLTLKDSNSYDPNLLKYYTVSRGNSAVKVSKTNNSITISTTKEISSSTPVLITLKYTYKDDGDPLKSDTMQ